MPGLISNRTVGITLPLAAAAILAAACGGATQAASAGSTPTTSAAPPSPPAETTTAPATTTGPTVTLRTEKGGYGVWLTDQTGRTLYLLTSDKGTTSHCYGTCAKDWPPLLTTGPVTAAGAAVAHDLGTTKRTDGTTQVTYAGHPLYHFARETGPDQVKGLGAQGIGFLVAPNGSAIKPPPMAPPRMTPPPMMKPTMKPTMAPPPMR